MYFDALPNEILTNIYLSLPSISCAIALSATCYRLNTVYHSSQELAILHAAADAEFGPVQDIIQLATHNASQPAHIRRSVPLSKSLLRQIVQVGRTAQRFEEIYPIRKWKSDYARRRLLTPDERFVLRRAIYRLWLYDRAFHNASHVRTCRRIPEVVRERAALLHNFSTSELAEMLDVHIILRDIIANNICPSNGKIRHKCQKRFPDGHFQGFSPWNSIHMVPALCHEPMFEGWGDEISHYYIIEDMMKLDPEQILYLRDHCPLKSQVESFVKCVGDWFANNGETFCETLEFVIRQRGGDFAEVKAAVEDAEVGVVVDDCRTS